MKRIFLILFIGSVLCSCSNKDINSEQLLFLLSDIYYQKKCNVVIEDNSNRYDLTVDKQSFIDNQTNITYFKYIYKDEYQSYSNNEVKDVEINNKYLNDLFYLTDALLYNSNNFTITDKYILKQESFYKFDLDFFNEKLTSFEAYYQDSSVVIECKVDQEKIKFIFSNSEIEILPYGEDKQNYSNFYKNNMIDYQQFNSINKLNCVVVLASKNCYACQMLEVYLYQFVYEYNYDLFYILDVDTLNQQEVQEIVLMLQSTYINQDEIFKSKQYLSYPSNILTPTLLKYLNNEPLYMMIGFDEQNVNALPRFCSLTY